MKLKYELRGWQKVALRAWSEAGNRGIVEVVTGGGKTVLAEACILSLLSKATETRVLIVVPTVSLQDQWIVSLQEELRVSSKSIASFGGRGKPREPKQINVIVANSARELTRQLTERGNWMLIADECHRYGSRENLKAISGSFIATLGLSATPERDYDNALSDEIIPRLGNVIYSYDIRDARADEVVSPFTLINVRTDLLSDERAEYERLTKRLRVASARKIRMSESGAAEPSDQNIERLLRMRARVSNLASSRVAVACQIATSHRGDKVMIFHEDIAKAEAVYHILRDLNLSVARYHSKISSRVRQSNLQLYRRNIYEVMVSCRALDEGINIPETQVAIIAAGSAGSRQRVQRLGRVLRPARGKRHALIYTLYCTNIEEERLAQEARLLDGFAEIKWMRANVGS